MAVTATALMAAMAAAAPSAATIGAVGAGLGAAGSIYSGFKAKQGADYEAKQLKAKGDEEFAVGQRKAMQADREKDLAQSRIQAVAAASGGGVDNETITNLMEGVEQQGDYNSMLELYQGRSSQSKAYAGAANRRAEGRSALTGSIINAGAKAAGSIYSIYK